MTEPQTATDRISRLKLQIKEFPTTPGIYLMKSATEKIIYVGKAKNLRSRVRSYFNGNHEESPKTRFLVNQIHSIEYILTNTEVEAFLLEASMIKKHRPRYNIRLKDDKAYPYIRLSMADAFPRFYLSRKVIKDGSLYFGPYTNSFAVHGTINFLNQTFRIRDCKDNFMRARKRPCLTYEIGRCSAPCVQYISQEDYRADIQTALDFLRGKNKSVLKTLKSRMQEASRDERFELAAKLRDSVSAIEAVLEKQSVVNTSEKDQDVIGFFGDERGTLIETLHIRHGRMIGRRSHFIPLLDSLADGEDVREWLTSFLNQYYLENVIPDEVLLSIDLGVEVSSLLQSVLKERSGAKVRVFFPTDQAGHLLVEMAESNAQSRFAEYVSKSDAKMRGLELIQSKFHLAKLPKRIECYDISNFQGSEIVASQVVFEDGAPSKDHYRRYRIRSVDGANDFASMREVIGRRLQHTEYDPPDLIVVDGGRGQLNKAVEILKELGRTEIPVVGLAKARAQGNFDDPEVTHSEERFFIPGRANPVLFPKNSEALHILVGLRDEAHRFAINYHRKLREASSLESELDLVIGLGEKRKKILLEKFGDIQQLRQANRDEIAKLPSFNSVLADRILLQLNSK